MRSVAQMDKGKSGGSGASDQRGALKMSEFLNEPYVSVIVWRRAHQRCVSVFYDSEQVTVLFRIWLDC